MKDWRAVVAWIVTGAAGVVLGLGVAWVESAFAIPKNIVAWFWIVLMAAALSFAGWAGWGYYRAVRDEDEWE